MCGMKLRWSLGMDKHFHHTHYWACYDLSMLGLKWIRVSKRGYRHEFGFALLSLLNKYTIILITMDESEIITWVYWDSYRHRVRIQNISQWRHGMETFPLLHLHLCRESDGFPSPVVSNTGLWYFLWCVPEQMIKKQWSLRRHEIHVTPL